MLKQLSKEQIFGTALTISTLSIIGAILTVTAENIFLSPINQQLAAEKAAILAQTELEKAQIKAQADLEKVRQQNKVTQSQPQQPEFAWATRSETDQTIVGCFFGEDYYPLESGYCPQPQG